MIKHDNNYKTGDTCPHRASWVCSMHMRYETIINKGVVFPKCGHGTGHDTTWWELESTDYGKMGQ